MEKEKQVVKSYSLARIIKAGWINFRRNSFLSFGATGILALALLVLSGLIILNFFTDTVVSSLDEKVDVSVYFQDSAKEDQILKIKSDLEGLNNVKAVAYVSKEQALEDFKSRHGTDQLIQDSISELDYNPLQSSLNVKATAFGQYASIVKFLEDNPLKTAIDKINFYENEAAINRIESISKGLSVWGTTITIFLALVAVLVTFNTIRLTIYNKKEEIEIMKLVGASSWHIRGPFVAEGAFYGIFAAILALAIFYPAIHFASPKVLSFAPNINLQGYFMNYLGEMLLVVFGVGLLLGMISSGIAIRKHLKI
ncbi:MAG: permease-like cell division protein FtsX [bacterium]|nr:permease-like cell division protein FtsX [bacterium]